MGSLLHGVKRMMPEIANYDEALARERKTLPRRQWWQWWARYNDEREARLRALANVVHGQGMYLTTFYRLFEAHERRCEERHKEVLERIDAHLNAHEAGR